MPRRYAEGTTVSVEKSQSEVQKLVRKYGGVKFGLLDAEDDRLILVAFQMRNRILRFRLKTPNREAVREVKRGFYSVQRGMTDDEYQRELARLWRALKLTIQAKMESVESNIETFDEAFMANIVIPRQNVTIGEWIGPELESVYDGGELPRLLPG